MFSLLEQHKDGSWWYHPGDTFDTEEEVEKCFQETYWWDPERPHMTFEHDETMFQEYSTCTFDFKTFHFGGMIHWPKSLEGTFLRRNDNDKDLD